MRRPDLRWLSVLLCAFAMPHAVAETATSPQATHLPDDIRESVSRIVILPTDGSSKESVTGTYEQETDGLSGGMARGAGVGQVPIEVGHVPVVIPIPILRELGMLVGGIRGTAQRYIQDMHDRMTDDLINAVEQPLTNTALATDVYWGLRNVSSVDPKLYAVTTPIPQDTDAILYINIDEVTLNIQKDEAIITTSATARLDRYSDGAVLYRREVNYQDRDTLKNWAKNDYALWTEYRIFARHYIGRELSAELYERVAMNHSLAPAYSGAIKPDKKNTWMGKTKTRTPTLTWQFELLGDDAGAVNTADLAWDIEIYDAQRPVYSAQRVPGLEHTVGTPLEACKTYRWSVRPVYPAKDGTRNGAWMRATQAGTQADGLVGRKVSAAHAYIQDFPALEVDCKAK